MSYTHIAYSACIYCVEYDIMFSYCPCPLFVFMYNFLDTVRVVALFAYVHAFALLIFEYHSLFTSPNGSPSPNNNTPLKSTINKHVPHFLLHTEPDCARFRALSPSLSINAPCIYLLLSIIYFFCIVAVSTLVALHILHSPMLFFSCFSFTATVTAIFDAYSIHFNWIELNGWLDSFESHV